jgi:hypothetical protein
MSNTDSTTSAAPDAPPPIIQRTVPARIQSAVTILFAELKAIPSEVAVELAKAKDHVLAAISYVESHCQLAKNAPETDVPAIKTNAGEVQAAVEKAA